MSQSNKNVFSLVLQLPGVPESFIYFNKCIYLQALKCQTDNSILNVFCDLSEMQACVDSVCAVVFHGV